MANHLRPDRYPQLDFFVADLKDAIPKDDMASMEHPIFALRAGDHHVRHYERNGWHVQVQPGAHGRATIHDKDIWIYCISQLIAALNRGEIISPTVRFVAYDFLVTTNRDTSGRAYERLSNALARLRQTTIETNLETGSRRERAGFGLIDSWHVIERDDSERMVSVEVELPRWLFRAIQNVQVKTINRDYFRLRKPLDRRIYELATKHCGRQARWPVGVPTLHQKSGSQAPLRNFRRDIKRLSESGELPDYQMSYDAQADTVTFYAKDSKGAHAQLQDLRKALET